MTVHIGDRVRETGTYDSVNNKIFLLGATDKARTTKTSLTGTAGSSDGERIELAVQYIDPDRSEHETSWWTYDDDDDSITRDEVKFSSRGAAAVNFDETDGALVIYSTTSSFVVKRNVQVGLRAYLNTDNNLSSGVMSKVVFDVEEWDDGGNFTSGTFTEPQGGRRLISGYLRHASCVDGDAIAVTVNVNGTVKSIAYSFASGSNHTAQFNTVLDLQSGDTVEIHTENATTGSTVRGLSGHTFLSVVAL